MPSWYRWCSSTSGGSLGCLSEDERRGLHAAFDKLEQALGLIQDAGLAHD